MPTKDERLKHVTLKVKRAKEHITELETETRRFLDTDPYKVGTKHDPQTRELVYYVTSVEPTPDCLSLIAGDAIQCLMSALDHLAYQLVCSDTGDNPPNPSRIYFPIADSPSEYESRKGGKVKGASQDTIDAIDALKPYKGGNDLLWMLYKLNNVEKHRLLLTVGSQAAGVHLGDMITTSGVDFFPPEVLEGFEAMTVFLNPADKGFPLKEGFELLRVPADAEPNPKQKFRFQVAFSESGVAEGKPLLETLHQLANLVEGIVTALTPRLREYLSHSNHLTSYGTTL